MIVIAIITLDTRLIIWHTTRINTALEGIMGLKLEVGSEYVTEDGRIVRINSVNSIGHFYCTHADADLDDQVWLLDGSVWMCKGHESKHRLVRIAYSEPVAPADPTGPVRSVTKLEVVPGKYGNVRVQNYYPDGLNVDFTKQISLRDAAELRAAIATLTEIADALEDQ